MSQNGQVMEPRERAASRESLFDELLDSGDEIERHEPRRRRMGLQHYAFLDGSTQMLDVDDSLVLPEQIVAYNRKRSREHHLLLSEVSALRVRERLLDSDTEVHVIYIYEEWQRCSIERLYPSSGYVLRCVYSGRNRRLVCVPARVLIKVSLCVSMCTYM